jgi:hypothetical protein
MIVGRGHAKMVAQIGSRRERVSGPPAGVVPIEPLDDATDAFVEPAARRFVTGHPRQVEKTEEGDQASV